MEEPFSDDEDEYEDKKDPRGVSMICPRRSAVLELLTPDFRLGLKKNVSESITTRCARQLLRKKRFKYVLETRPIGHLRLHDSKGKVYLYWKVARLRARFYLRENTRKLSRAVA